MISPSVAKYIKEFVVKNNETIANLRLEIENLQKKIASISIDNNEAILCLQAECTHPNSKKIDGIYMSGGYDHVSEQPYTVVCSECNKVLESKCIRGTYA